MLTSYGTKGKGCIYLYIYIYKERGMAWGMVEEPIKGRNTHAQRERERAEKHGEGEYEQTGIRA